MYIVILYFNVVVPVTKHYGLKANMLKTKRRDLGREMRVDIPIQTYMRMGSMRGTPCPSQVTNRIETRCLNKSRL